MLSDSTNTPINRPKPRLAFNPNAGGPRLHLNMSSSTNMIGTAVTTRHSTGAGTTQLLTSNDTCSPASRLRASFTAATTRRRLPAPTSQRLPQKSLFTADDPTFMEEDEKENRGWFSWITNKKSSEEVDVPEDIEEEPELEQAKETTSDELPSAPLSIKAPVLLGPRPRTPFVHPLPAYMTQFQSSHAPTHNPFLPPSRSSTPGSSDNPVSFRRAPVPRKPVSRFFLEDDEDDSQRLPPRPRANAIASVPKRTYGQAQRDQYAKTHPKVPSLLGLTEPPCSLSRYRPPRTKQVDDGLWMRKTAIQRSFDERLLESSPLKSPLRHKHHTSGAANPRIFPRSGDLYAIRHYSSKFTDWMYRSQPLFVIHRMLYAYDLRMRLQDSLTEFFVPGVEMSRDHLGRASWEIRWDRRWRVLRMLMERSDAMDVDISPSLAITSAPTPAVMPSEGVVRDTDSAGTLRLFVIDSDEYESMDVSV